MKKTILLLMTVLCFALGAVAFAACSDEGKGDGTEKESATITVSDITENYDGTPKKAESKVVPENAGSLEVVYKLNGQKVDSPADVGEYTVEVNLISETHCADTKTATLKILPKELNISGIEVKTKNDDGTSAAEYKGTPSLVGVVEGDEVLINIVSVEFKDSLDGYRKDMKVVAELSGKDAGNYKLAENLDVKGTIRPVINGFVLTEIVDDNDFLVAYTVTDYVDRAEKAEIPASHKLKEIVSVSDRALLGNARLKEVTIPATVEKIGIEAFRESAVRKVIFAKDQSNEKELEIMARAFAFSAITEITFPSRVDYLGIGVLQNTTDLSSVVFEDREKDIEWETEADGASWTMAWSNITSLTIGDGLTFLPKNFARDSGLSQLTFSDRTSSATLGIGETAFFGTKLVNLNIPAFVTFMGIGCFQNTANLENVAFAPRQGDIEWGKDKDGASWTFAFSNVKKIEINGGLKAIPKTFAVASGLTQVKIGENVERIGMHAFRETKLVSVMIPSSVKIIDDGAFSVVNTLTNLTFADGASELKILQFAFFQTAIASLNVSSRVRYIGWAAFAEIGTLSELTFEEGETPLVIANDAFNVCGNLKSVTLPERLYAYNTNVFDEGCAVANGEGKAIEALDNEVFDPDYVIQ